MGKITKQVLIVNYLINDDEPTVVKQKKCIHCKQLRDMDYFEKKKHERNHRNVCKICRKSNLRKLNRIKKAWLQIPGNILPVLGTACEVCGRTDKKLYFDHDHSTEKFRGFLCRTCNTAIGQLGDDVAGIMSALGYLIHAAKRNGDAVVV